MLDFYVSFTSGRGLTVACSVFVDHRLFESTPRYLNSTNRFSLFGQLIE